MPPPPPPPINPFVFGGKAKLSGLWVRDREVALRMILAHIGRPYEGKASSPSARIPTSTPTAAHCTTGLSSSSFVDVVAICGSAAIIRSLPVDGRIAGMRALNDMREGTRLPRLNMDKMEAMVERDSLKLLGIS